MSRWCKNKKVIKGAIESKNFGDRGKNKERKAPSLTVAKKSNGVKKGLYYHFFQKLFVN